MNTTERERRPSRPIPNYNPTLRLVYSGDDGIIDVPPLPLTAGACVIGREEVGGRTPGRASDSGAPAEPEIGGLALPDDRRVSRVHATIHVSSGGQTLRFVDAGSTNGSYVNGERTREALLGDGDVVRVGDSFLVVRYVPPWQIEGEMPSMVGSSPAIVATRARLLRVASTDETLLLTGETGSGKEVAARAVHAHSPRAAGPFVAVNCGAIPEGLAESQLFGHVIGAFTGAHAHPGFFRSAHGGTLFLDEVGELPKALQPKLLRVLEDHTVLALGSTHPFQCDVRVISATNRDLVHAVHATTFRGDVYARLSGITVTLPPLRDRREDILALLVHALGDAPHAISPRLVEALLLYEWPYNVRELFKIAGQLRALGGQASALDLELVACRLIPPNAEAAREVAPARPHARGPTERPWGPGVTAPTGTPIARIARARVAVEIPSKEQIQTLLQSTRGTVSSVAQSLGCSRWQLYRWMKQYNLDLDSYRVSGKRPAS